MSRVFDVLHETGFGAGPADPAAVRPPEHPAPQHDHPAATQDDAIAKLVQRIFILAEGTRAPQAVAFCGVDENAGCTWVCARAAETLAKQSVGRVCVVDANLRAPSLHRHFHADQSPGLADAVRGAGNVGEFVRPAGWNGNLWFLAAGNVGIEPNGALSPVRLRTRFTELRGEFDYVLLDTPSLGAYPDALLLGQLCDGVVLVVGSNSTRREPARLAKENLDAARVPILGAVLNRRTYPIPEALYRRL